MAKRKKFVLQNVFIESYAAEGKCIARVDDKVIFVEGAVPGDVADIFVYKNKKDWAEAKVNRINQHSSDRVESLCAHFGVCGGCKWQMLPYDKQLQYKEQQVKDQLRRIGHVEVLTYLPILACDEQYYYRNKVEFTFSTKQYIPADMLQSDMPTEKNVLGFHAPTFFDKVIDIDTCHLQHEPTNAIKNFLREYASKHEIPFYDIRAHKGFLRNLVIRRTQNGQVMVNLIVAERDMDTLEPLLSALSNQFPEITSLQYTINTKLNDSIYDLDVISFKGLPYIEESLGKFRYHISPKSFFQTNSLQAEVLYSVVKEFAQCKGHEVLYDLYCGTGSIGIFLSDVVQKIIGVETVADAIEDAKRNAELNQLQNTHFVAGDVIHICDDAFFAKHGKPDIIIIDPPRAGCHDKLLQKLLEIRAPRMVYVSCNPATQARDLRQLSELYNIALSQAVDMFPHTHHIENVVLLTLKPSELV